MSTSPAPRPRVNLSRTDQRINDLLQGLDAVARRLRELMLATPPMPLLRYELLALAYLAEAAAIDPSLDAEDNHTERPF
jgi:hypothetical protein